LFFEDLQVRQPNEMMNIRASSFASQMAQIVEGSERLFLAHRPDRVLILGDTNSGLAAIVARRLGIPVYHMEAGNRCFDDRVPEEVNRRVIDHSSTVLLPYTGRSKENLVREGIPVERIYVTGNPIKEVIDRYASQIQKSQVCAELEVKEGEYFLVTMHRAENVDIPQRLQGLVSALASLHARYGFPVICSFHPRTRAKVKEFGIDIEREGLRFVDPLGFFDFVHLEQRAFCLLSDSGTVQEEACIFGVPNVTLRDVTERPETVECGSNALSGADEKQILSLVEMVTQNGCKWTAPPEYLATNVSDTVARIVLGYRMPDLAELKWCGLT
jgi:UDP-N-acetylglucosamine 2-epimerase (non-hydrolysing)